ncbi:MAG: cupredoxin domain-containing protein [Nitrososphaera sp.]
MTDAIIIPVAVGLVIGVILIVIFATIFPLPPVGHPRDIVVIVPAVTIPEGAAIDRNFEPATIKVVIGTNNTVRWANADSFPSSIIADNYSDPDFFSSTHDAEGNPTDESFLLPGESFEFTFRKAGVFGYHSEPHPWMQGTVIVLENTQEISEKEPAQMPSLDPRISKEEAVEIAVQDLTTRYIKNPPLIKIYAIVDEQSQGAAYPTIETFLKENYTLVMAHTAANGTFYFVDANAGTLEECHIPYCPLPEQGMEALKGRFAWMVDLVTQCDNYPNYGADIIYGIDAKTGQIVWHHNSSQYEPQQPFVCS